MLNRNRDRRPINWRRLGLILLAGGAVYAIGVVTSPRATPDLDAIADAQRDKLIEEGWGPVIVVDADELGEIAPDIDIEVLDEIDAPPVIALDIHTDEVEIDLPNCVPVDINDGSTAAPVDFFDIDETVVELPSVPGLGQPQRPLLSANVQAIGAVDLKGRLYLNGAIKATMRLPDDSWSRSYDLPIDPDTSTVAVSDDIATALRIMVRGYRSVDWRLGSSFSADGALGLGVGRSQYWGRKWGWYVNGGVDLTSVDSLTAALVVCPNDDYDDDDEPDVCQSVSAVSIRDARVEVGLTRRRFE